MGFLLPTQGSRQFDELAQPISLFRSQFDCAAASSAPRRKPIRTLHCGVRMVNRAPRTPVVNAGLIAARGAAGAHSRCGPVDLFAGDA
jgi:hypothetical protein